MRWRDLTGKCDGLAAEWNFAALAQPNNFAMARARIDARLPWRAAPRLLYFKSPEFHKRARPHAHAGLDCTDLKSEPRRPSVSECNGPYIDTGLCGRSRQASFCQDYPAVNHALAQRPCSKSRRTCQPTT